MRTSLSTSRHQRGSALLTAVIFVSVILAVSAGILLYAGKGRERATQIARGETELSCAESGLQLARAYFLDPAHAGWNSYLSKPNIYNPVPATWNTTPADPTTAAGLAAIQAADSTVLFDLDNDGKADVYVYIRDNADETGTQNWKSDTDLSVYVGAVCVSTTLAPRTNEASHLGGPNLNPLVAEALLQLPAPPCGYGSQHGACLGNGNQN